MTGIMGGLDGSLFRGKGATIRSSQDGKCIWVEGTYFLNANERLALRDMAQNMGARLTDPDGVYRRSVNNEAQFSRDTWQIHCDGSRELGVSGDYVSRSTRQVFGDIEESRLRELGYLG